MKSQHRLKYLFAVVSLSVLLTPFSCKRQCESSKSSSSHGWLLAALEPYPQDAGEVEFDQWYSIHMQDQLAGSMHFKVSRHKTPRGWRRLVTTQEKIVLRRAGHRMEISSRDKSLESESGQLLRHEHIERQTGGDEVVIQAGKLGAKMVTVRGPEVTRVAFEPQAYGPQLTYRILFGDGSPKAGEVITFRTYSSQTAGYTNNRLVIRAGSDDDDAQSAYAEHSIEALPGVGILLKLNGDHLPLEMETTLGALRLRLKLQKQPPESSPSISPPDLNPMLKVISNVTFQDRNAIACARYRLEGLPDHVDEQWLSGPGQRVVDRPATGTFILEVKRLAAPDKVPFPPRMNSAESDALRPYLASTALAQASEPAIQSIAKRVTSNATDSWSAAKRLRQWVSQKVKSHMGMAFASAVEVLRKGKGDCTEQSVLLAALGRAVGIPTRCVMGLVYQDGAFARHMWTEVWVKGWHPLDAAMQTDSISAAWIRIGEHSLKLTSDKKSGMGGMLAFVAELKVIVQHFTADSSRPTLGNPSASSSISCD